MVYAPETCLFYAHQTCFCLSFRRATDAVAYRLIVFAGDAVAYRLIEFAGDAIAYRLIVFAGDSLSLCR